MQTKNIILVCFTILLIISCGKPTFKETLKKAENGDVEAQFEVAEMYYFGKETLQNKNKAFEWYKKSAENGNKKAQYNMGLIYLSCIGGLYVHDKFVSYSNNTGNYKVSDYKNFIEEECYKEEGYTGGLIPNKWLKEKASYWIKKSYNNGYDRAKIIWSAYELSKYE